MILGEVQTLDINDHNVSQKKSSFVILHYDDSESYLFLNKTKIFIFKGFNNIPLDLLFLRSGVSKDFTEDEIKQIGLNGVVYEF